MWTKSFFRAAACDGLCLSTERRRQRGERAAGDDDDDDDDCGRTIKSFQLCSRRVVDAAATCRSLPPPPPLLINVKCGCWFAAAAPLDVDGLYSGKRERVRGCVITSYAIAAGGAVSHLLG